uniref:Uncharacterized protein n=1 Tax=Timema tahoe TaxID=61484 RepID=A0A7R9FHM6_9NEOP|nr:unnamed protein product [Timema tahoe]
MHIKFLSQSQTHHHTPGVYLPQELVSSPSSFVGGSGEREQLAALSLVTGYMRLLGSALQDVFTSKVHFEKVVIGLVQVARLDTSGVSVLGAPGIIDIENQNSAVETHSWKQFCHFTGSSVLAKLEEVCSLLGQLADLDSLVHYLLNLLCEGSEYSKEVIFVLNLVLAAGLCAGDTSALLLVRIVLDAYIDPDFWHLPTSVSTEVTLSQAQSNIVQCCLLVEGVGKCSKNHIFNAPYPTSLHNILIHPELLNPATNNKQQTTSGQRFLTLQQTETQYLQNLPTYNLIQKQTHINGIRHECHECYTENLIYQLQCNYCIAEYVCLTTGTLRRRMNGHRFNTNHKDPDKPVALPAQTHNADFD